jgi:hypothetical protein
MVSEVETNLTIMAAFSIALLSVIILFPLAFRQTTGEKSLPFPVAPFVALNFLYFVVGSIPPLAFPNQTLASVKDIPLSVLFLCLGFFVFNLGIWISGTAPTIWPADGRGARRIPGLGAILVVSLVILWAVRIFLGTEGVGISHAVMSLILSERWLGELAVLAGALAYVPLCLCLTRLCSGSLEASEVRFWRRALFLVVASDIGFWMFFAGSRLPILWEVLIVFWAFWMQRLHVVGKKTFIVLGAVCIAALPIVYAQRYVLQTLAPRVGENQMQLARDYLFSQQFEVLQGAPSASLRSGALLDVARFSAIDPFSIVAGKEWEEDVPPMWGETLKHQSPILVPRRLWPSKPVVENVDFVVARHFNARPVDVVTTVQTELMANFGIVGLCGGLFIFGIFTGKFFRALAGNLALSESTIFLQLSVIPVIFFVETDITGIVAGLRQLLPLWLAFWILEGRRRSRR